MSEADEKAIVGRLKFYGGILDRMMGDKEEWSDTAEHYLDTFIETLCELPEKAKHKEEFLRKAVDFFRQMNGFDKVTSPEEPVTSVEYCEQDVPRQFQVKSCVSEQATEDTECLREVAQGLVQSEEEDISLEALFSTGTEDIDWCNEATQVMNQFEEDDMSLEALFATVTEDTDCRNEESQVKDCDPLGDQEPDKEGARKDTTAMDRAVIEPMVARSAMVLEQDGVTSKSEEGNLEKQMVETEPSETQEIVSGREPKSEPVKVMDDVMVCLVDADVTLRKFEKATVIELVVDGKSFAEELCVIWKRKDRGPPDLDWKRRKKTQDGEGS